MNANDAIIAASASSHASHADPRHDASRVIRAPRGSQLTCKSWLTEAAYRMIQNNLDPEVAERPQDLVVYGGIGRAARGPRDDPADGLFRVLRVCRLERPSKAQCQQDVLTSNGRDIQSHKFFLYEW